MVSEWLQAAPDLNTSVIPAHHLFPKPKSCLIALCRDNPIPQSPVPAEPRLLNPSELAKGLVSAPHSSHCSQEREQGNGEGRRNKEREHPTKGCLLASLCIEVSQCKFPGFHLLLTQQDNRRRQSSLGMGCRSSGGSLQDTPRRPCQAKWVCQGFLCCGKNSPSWNRTSADIK